MSDTGGASDARRERWLISGRVQGVGYRAFAREVAQELGASGWVRNLRDGRVEAEVTATAAVLAELERELRRGPFASRVDEIARSVLAPGGSPPRSFEIRRTP
ncbi:MAG TPA: acylphosphatase [Thermoanaerobaculia bacterium]|nr:acylphosphatase [Thermoanaerobaculia bacterium]